ncbi:Zn-dependent exopeptidase [Pleurotus eryngii]|uniref:Zn-dependent exopeptidase n=1 Tax=Pleurotus eryngii TaxID=5323 RepID=A0A9P6D511_PLEER|nr:Zn-dependent exopeptidase [Pleurotus eryngii]
MDEEKLQRVKRILDNPDEHQNARHGTTPRLFASGWKALTALVVITYTTYAAVSLRNVGSARLGGHPPRRHFLFGREAEKVFLSVPNEASAIIASRRFATKPHLAGAPQDLQTAKDFLAVLQRELGIVPPTPEPLFPAGSEASRHATESITKLKKPAAWIDTYYPVMNTPLGRELVVVAKNGTIVWEADLVEEADATDPEAHLYADAVPTFHGLSPEGTAVGQLVYANYGTQEDYSELVSQGVNLTGSIVICRYGGIFRGLKVKGAQELGAAGVLIYSDPRDDGTVTEENGYKAYPHGPARSVTSVQRGSVQYLSIYPGDPTTPGYPSYENSTRTEGSNIPKIPSLPISWANAKVLNENFDKGGSWEGMDVKLVNKVDKKVTPIWNTMGVIPGFIPNEIVMLGNHRDAWVMGATDPSSGTASVHEIIRGFGELLRRGWKPLRTVVIASWDAEEYGLIGSTEYGEDFASWLGENVVAYLNLDSSVSGSRFSVSGSPSLAHLIRQTAEELPHPTEAGRSLWSATSDSGKLFGLNASSGAVSSDIREGEITSTAPIGVNPLGSGSDYTVFLQWIGIPCGNGGFSSTLHDPVYHYHSVFDSERWQEIYGDPGFSRHVAVSKHLGLQALRLSSSLVLPFNTTHYVEELDRYLDGVVDIAASLSIDLDVSPLRSSIHKLRITSVGLDLEKRAAQREFVKWLKVVMKWRSGRTVRRVICRFVERFGFKCSSRDATDADTVTEEEQLPDKILLGLARHSGHSVCPHFLRKNPLRELREAAKRVYAVNKKLSAFERGFLSEEGIKDREWYKHLAVAPGKWLGYGATTLPGLTEALTFEKNATLAEYEVNRLVTLLDQLAEKIRV